MWSQVSSVIFFYGHFEKLPSHFHPRLDANNPRLDANNLISIGLCIRFPNIIVSENPAVCVGVYRYAGWGGGGWGGKGGYGGP